MNVVAAEAPIPLPLLRRGKVRDVYDLGDQLLIVASDRLSAFDVVLPSGIPDKGKILTHGSWDYEFVDDIRPAPSDVVVPKARYSGFCGTTLDNILRARDIRKRDVHVDDALRLRHGDAIRPVRRARGNRRAPGRSRLERDLDLDRRVAPRVEDLPSVDTGDAAHTPASFAWSK